MSLWEYKVISSGKGGFATPALLEKFLNDLGRDEWEIVEFRAQPDNPLAFSGLARRSTQRDWTLQDAAAAAAKAEAEKLRAEFEAKFKAATSTAPVEERAPSFLEEKAAPDDGFRKPVDTSRDDDPEADSEKDDWDKLTAAEEDELPTFFEAIRPHMRRNQRGPGQSVGVDYLAKKWEQAEEDLKGALVECGFEVPEDEDSKPVYVEYEGDLYWLNMNRRGEIWINTKEKPRPMFKPFKGQRVEIEEEPKGEAQKSAEQRGPKAEAGRRPERSERPDRPERTERVPAPEGEAPAGDAAASAPTAAAVPGGPLPAGSALLEKIRPLMRRNRRGPGGSGSTSFLSRALKTSEDDLKTAFTALGFTLPAGPDDKPVYVEIGDAVWWLNLDSRGGLWINGREKQAGESLAPAVAPDAAASNAGFGEPPLLTAPPPVSVPEHEAAPMPAGIMGEVDDRGRERERVDSHPSAGAGEAAGAAAASQPVLTAARAHLKETRTGASAAKIDRLAEDLSQPAEALVAALVAAGLKVPEKPREKHVFVEQAGDAFWLNMNQKGELWLNAKPAKGRGRPESEEPGESTGENDAGSDESAEGAEATEGGEAGEKKPARRPGRSRKKPE